MAKKLTKAQQRKLDELNKKLGIHKEVETVQNRKQGTVIGYTEDEIQTFREIQGVSYFLQAPKLFTPKVCKECGEGFAVSRKYVAHCSYECIRKNLEREHGITWQKGKDLEALANDPDVWDGNEPIWLRNSALEKLKEILEHITENFQTSTPESPEVLPPEPSGNSLSQETHPLSASAPTMTSSGNGQRRRSTKKPVRKPKLS